jgi:hypothetical protein
MVVSRVVVRRISRHATRRGDAGEVVKRIDVRG